MAGLSGIAAALMACAASIGSSPAAAVAPADLLAAESVSSRARPRTAGRVELAGCDVVLAQPGETGSLACVVPHDGALRVWIDAAREARVVVHSNGGTSHERDLPAGQGRLFDVRVCPETPWIRVDVTQPGASFVETPYLAGARPRDEADTLSDMRRTDPKRAERLAARLLGHEDASIRARAAGIVARMRRDQGDLEGAKNLFFKAIDDDIAAGSISDRYQDSFALAYTLGVQLQRFDEARAVLARLDELAPRGLASPQHEARAPYYAALVAHEAGDLRAALEGYRASRERALRLGDLAQRADVLSQEALVLLDLGRTGEGAALYEEAAPLVLGLAPCAQATFFNNWSGFLLDVAAVSSGAETRDPEEPLSRALSLVDHACPSDKLRGFVAMNLAQVSLRAGDTRAAHDAVHEAQRALVEPDHHDAAQLADVEEQVAMAEGDFAAAWSANERLAAIAESDVLPYYLRRAALGRAELLEIAGDAAGAEAAYEEVERLASAGSLLAPLGEGRTGFLERLASGPAHHVAFLLRSREGAALAAKVARASESRLLSMLGTIEHVRGLGGEARRAWEARLSAYRLERERIESEAQGDWKLAAEERTRAGSARRAREERARAALEEALALSQGPNGASREPVAPREGELFLVYFALDPATWVGFAIARSGVVAQRIEGAAPGPSAGQAGDALLSERFLSPFRKQIERAKSLRFFVPNALGAIDFHALPFGDGLLIERLPVTYGLDVRGAEPGAETLSDKANSRSGTGGARAPFRALVVADPSGGLPEARVEGEIVQQRLAENGIAAGALSAQGDRRATAERVRAELEHGPLDLLHFAGHAHFSGTDGWGSRIPLADGGALTVSDVFALSSVPRLVVLSGCETGRADGLGLAHAFVAAGARAAVGTTRIVPDADAARVMALFYEGLRWNAPPAEASAGALRAAARALIKQGDTASWRSFRVFVP